jgi:hypothetical protein
LLVIALSLYLLDLKSVPIAFIGACVGASIPFIFSALRVLISKKAQQQVTIQRQDEREKLIRLKASDFSLKVLILLLSGFIIFKSTEQDESILFLIVSLVIVTCVEIISTYWFRERG